MVSVRGPEYRASANKEKRTESYARAAGENAKMRATSMVKNGQIPGHTHNCALSGCYGEEAKKSAQSVSEATSPEETGQVSHRFGGLPHLVGVDKK